MKILGRAILAGLLLQGATGAAIAADTAWADAYSTWNDIPVEAPPPLVEVVIDPATTGLMVMDMGEAACNEQQRIRCHWSIPAVKDVLDNARAAGMIIVFIRTRNMQPEDFVDAIAPLPDEPYFVGTKEDKLWDTGAVEVFREAGVDKLILMGHQANGSVMVTALGAAFRDFKVIVPVDTMSAATAYQEQFAIWEIAYGPAFRNGVSTMTRSDMLVWPED
jgi:nicotinamidase-related amidase